MTRFSTLRAALSPTQILVPEPYLVRVVSVVVVVVGPGLVVSDDVVVVLVLEGAAQPDSDTRTATRRLGRIYFFISLMVAWVVT